jgi:hypothetical protein
MLSEYRRIVHVFAFLVVATGTSAGAAEAPRWSVASGLGLALPLGSYLEGASMGDTLSVAIPLQLELDYLVSPRWSLGLDGQVGYGIATNCPAGASCLRVPVRLGLHVTYRVLAGQRLDPYVALGSGYEWMKLKAEAPCVFGSCVTSDETFGGFQFANLRVGLDYALSPANSVGPFVGVALGQFSSGISLGPIAHKALHGWLQFGVRGALRW